MHRIGNWKGGYATFLKVSEELAGNGAPDADIDQPVGGSFPTRQGNLQVVRRQRHAGAFLQFVQGEGRKALAHLRGEKGLALGGDDGADFLAALARHAAVHLSRGGCGGSARPGRERKDVQVSVRESTR